MMTKSTSTLRSVLVTASAFIVTLYTQAVLAYPGENWIRLQKDRLEKAGEAASATAKMWSHADHFIGSADTIDIIGRSYYANVFIAVLWLGLVLIALRKGEKMETSELYAKPVTQYLLAAAVGFVYEFLRTSGMPKAVNFADAASSLPVIALGFGIYFHFPRIKTFFEAMHIHELPYFLRTFELRPSFTGGGGGDEPEPSSQSESLPESGRAVEAVDAATESIPEAVPATARVFDSSLKSHCPKCNGFTKKGAKFCGACGALLCPFCSGLVKKGAKFCGVCRAQLSN